jgi:protocatechuate 3,4-dioxygenase beta subunit
MNRLILRVAIVLCAIALAGCATGTPVANAPTAAVVATSQAMQGSSPNVGNGAMPDSTSAGAAGQMPHPLISTVPAGSDALACSTGTSASLTPELTEGPFFKAGSPERTSLIDASTPGTKLVITGTVYTADCKPVAHALLDFWQADASGNYDNSGYNLRGHQYTDVNGRYTLTTIVPGLYTGRTEHIHVKVQAPNGRLITTQLFFPGVAQNDSDGIFNAALLMVVQKTSDGEQAQYNFVVPG